MFHVDVSSWSSVYSFVRRRQSCCFMVFFEGWDKAVIKAPSMLLGKEWLYFISLLSMNYLKWGQAGKHESVASCIVLQESRHWLCKIPPSPPNWYFYCINKGEKWEIFFFFLWPIIFLIFFCSLPCSVFKWKSLQALQSPSKSFAKSLIFGFTPDTVLCLLPLKSLKCPHCRLNL